MQRREVYVNMCDYDDSFQGTEVFKNKLNQRISYLNTTTNDKVTGVYIGKENCSRFLDRSDSNYYFEICSIIKKRKLNISYVVPPLSEEEMNVVKLRTLFGLLEKEQINEVIFNELGSVSWFRTYDDEVPIRLGRLFDKSIRETRFPAEGGSKKETITTIYRPIYFDEFYQKLFAEYKIKGFDLDTVPFHELEIKDRCAEVIGIHYPRIVLAQAYFCEYAINFGEPLDKECDYHCIQYLKKMTLQNGCVVHLNGKALITFQRKSFEQSVTTNNRLRMIYSGGENEYSSTD